SRFEGVSEFEGMCMETSMARRLVDRGVRCALNERGVATIISPEDVQEEDYTDPPREHGSVYTSIGWSPPRIIPVQADLERAAEVLNEGSKVAMLIGQGAADATDEVVD